jgi:hypothetical protein
MKGNRTLSIFIGIVASGLLCGLPSMAKGEDGPPPQASYGAPLDPGIKSTFVPLGPGVPGVLYEPATPGKKAGIAVFVMHAEGDYLRFSACTELSRRGYTVLCANNKTPKGRTSLDLNLDEILLDAKLGVAYLRKQSNIKKVVLFGHSGGGAMMSAYQNIAENGLKACQGPEKISKCSGKLAGLPAADGVILADANWGLAAMTLFSLDPAVSDERNGHSINPALDLFNPKNGFNPAGTTYSQEFIRTFQSAVSKRNNRIVTSALDRLALINAGKGIYGDDEPFVVPGAILLGFNNKLFAQDTRLISHTRKAWPLLHLDGSLTTEIVRSVRVPEGKVSMTPSINGALRGTVRTFLTTFAIRTTDDYGFNEDSVRGVDWTSNYSCPAGNTPGITTPLLAMGMTGHWEYLAAETLYESAGNSDKSLVFVEGAGHNYDTCTKCEKTPGQYGDTVKTMYNYVDGWLSKKGRFLD